jgi:hypothetical protein
VHKTPYPLLRGVCGGTRCISPFTVFNVWNRSTGCRNLKSARVCPGHRGRGHFSRWPEACRSETSTAQYTIYNIKKWGCLKARRESTHLKPSCHRTGTMTVPHPKPECDLRYQRIPLLAPPRAGQEPHPSKQTGANTPPHWRAETCSQTFFPRAMEFFLF